MSKSKAKSRVVTVTRIQVNGARALVRRSAETGEFLPTFMRRLAAVEIPPGVESIEWDSR